MEFAPGNLFKIIFFALDSSCKPKYGYVEFAPGNLFKIIFFALDSSCKPKYGTTSINLFKLNIYLFIYLLSFI